MSTAWCGSIVMITQVESFFRYIASSRKNVFMSEKQKKDVWVRVKDETGNEFICPIDALKDREIATAEELDGCVDNAVSERYSGNL